VRSAGSVIALRISLRGSALPAKSVSKIGAEPGTELATMTRASVRRRSLKARLAIAVLKLERRSSGLWPARLVLLRLLTMASWNSGASVLVAFSRSLVAW
jgi:hypothetical protein